MGTILRGRLACGIVLVAIAAAAGAAEAADGPGTLLWSRDFNDGKLGMYPMNVAAARMARYSLAWWRPTAASWRR